MKMGKLFSLAALTFLTLTLFAGCGGDTASNGGEKVLKVGCSADFAPFEFQEEGKAEYQGFDMDLVRAIGKEMGYKVEIQNIGFDGLIPALEAKNIDVIASGMTINEERKGKVAFSDPYYEAGLTMVVRDDNQDINSFKDLIGKRVAVQIGTTSAAEVAKIANVEVKSLNTVSDCFMELRAGGVDAVVNDRPVNDYYIKRTNSAGVKALPERLSAEEYGMAMRKDDKELQEKFNAAFKKVRESGEYKKIFDTWFGGQ